MVRRSVGTGGRDGRKQYREAHGEITLRWEKTLFAKGYRVINFNGDQFQSPYTKVVSVNCGLRNRQMELKEKQLQEDASLLVNKP